MSNKIKDALEYIELTKVEILNRQNFLEEQMEILYPKGSRVLVDGLITQKYYATVISYGVDNISCRLMLETDDHRTHSRPIEECTLI